MRQPVPSSRWTRINELFNTTVEMSGAERAAFLRSECGDDRELQQEVLQLLEYDTEEDPPLLSALQSEAAGLVGDEPAAGRLLGPWRIEHEIGRGGMAVVYLGNRVDGAYRKQAAIKLIKRGMDTQAVIARLHQERSILAGLDHPYIARLLDGGATPDGRPYIVMDYVEGTSIDHYCNDHNLDIDARCQLIGKVCEAVAYAHRNLVVHRDLKPANILVSADGQPKLLDFGIARLLSQEGSAGAPETRGLFRPLTPEYASPEQRNGGTVGTTADVYSLGVVLYELLAGERPSATGEFIKASLAALRNGRGKRWSRQLAGDLDNILQMALQPEPERRYLSMGQFQADLDLHRKGLPVKARDETFVYRCGKFLSRHRLGALSAALLCVSLAGGVTATFWQARRAEAEKRTADQRFEQVRELARKFLFDVDDMIAPLPGSILARRMVVETGAQYYDSLLKDAGDNKELLEQIARGYDRLGDLQGNGFNANLGDIPGAEVSYRKALAIRSRITDPSPTFLTDRIQSNLKMGEILYSKNDFTGAAQYLRLAIALGNNTNAAKSQETREFLARAWGVLGDVLSWKGDTGGAIDAYSRIILLREQLARDSPARDSPARDNPSRNSKDPFTAQRDVNVAHYKLADLYSYSGRAAESALELRGPFEYFTKIAAANPADDARARVVCLAVQTAARDLKYGAGQILFPAQQLSARFQQCIELFTKETAADPGDTRALSDLASESVDAGDWMQARNQPREAAAAWNRGMAAAEKLVAISTAGITGNEPLFVELHWRLGTAAARAAHFDDALAQLHKADEYASGFEKTNPGSPMAIIHRDEIAGARAEVYMAQKRWKDAVKEIEAAIAGDQSIELSDPKNLMPVEDSAEKYQLLAQCYANDGKLDAAIDSMKKATQRFEQLVATRPLTSTEEEKRRGGLARLADWTKH